MNLNNFDKWNMLPMSYSKLNQWKTFPTQFVIQRIYGHTLETSPAMTCGHVVEEMLYKYMQGQDPDINEVLLKFEDSFENYSNIEEVEKYLKLIPEFYKNCEPLFNKLGNMELTSYQEEIKTEILGVPFIGYTDFIFKIDNEIYLYDLKTKGRMTKSHGEYLQQAIYKKALEEKYECKVNCNLYVVTPKKYEFIELEITDAHIIEIENTLKGMNKVFEFCNTEEDFAYLFQPNLDDFIWANPLLTKHRKDIWGV